MRVWCAEKQTESNKIVLHCKNWDILHVAVYPVPLNLLTGLLRTDSLFYHAITWEYSQTCVKQALNGKTKNGLRRQVLA